MGLNGKKTIIGIIGLAVFGGLSQAFPDQEWLTYVAQAFGGMTAVGVGHKVKKWKDGKAVFGLLVALSLGMSGCASLQGHGILEGLGDAGKAALKGAAEDANLMKHLKDFFDEVGELIFGDDTPDEVPSEPPAVSPETPSGETSLAG